MVAEHSCEIDVLECLIMKKRVKKGSRKIREWTYKVEECSLFNGESEGEYDHHEVW